MRLRETSHYLLGVDLEELVDRCALIVPIELQPQDRLLFLRGRVVPRQLLEAQAQQDMLASGGHRARTPLGRGLLLHLTLPGTTRRGLLFTSKAEGKFV